MSIKHKGNKFCNIKNRFFYFKFNIYCIAMSYVPVNNYIRNSTLVRLQRSAQTDFLWVCSRAAGVVNLEYTTKIRVRGKNRDLWLSLYLHLLWHLAIWASLSYRFGLCRLSLLCPLWCSFYTCYCLAHRVLWLFRLQYMPSTGGYWRSDTTMLSGYRDNAGVAPLRIPTYCLLFLYFLFWNINII